MRAGGSSDRAAYVIELSHVAAGGSGDVRA
jgi:hypothetical protein